MLSDKEIAAGLDALEKKFNQDIQVFLWSKNQERVELIRAIRERLKLQ